MKWKNVNQWAKKKGLVATVIALAALCFPGAAFAQGNIEAASYNNQNSVQTENCAEGGLDVGYISNGSWVEYNQMGLNGMTAFQARVVSDGSGGNNFHLSRQPEWHAHRHRSGLAHWRLADVDHRHGQPQRRERVPQRLSRIQRQRRRRIVQRRMVCISQLRCSHASRRL